MLNFAHRGFSGKYPENTMLAFQKALESGADGIELDVQLTRDNRLVIIHDERVDRTTDGTGFVRDFTLSDIQQLNAAGTYAYTLPPVSIPTFREYCHWVKQTDLLTNIELKNGVYDYPGIEAEVWQVLQEFQLQDQVIISSFNHASILRMKQLAPQLTYGLLTESWLINPGKYTRDLGVACYHPLYGSLTDDTVAEIKRQGIRINTFTVNDEEAVRKLLKQGIDCVITNYPDMVRRIVQGG